MSEKVYSITWHTTVTATSKVDAINKAKRQMLSPTRLMVEEVKLPKQHDPKTHCRHGLLWSAYCDRC